MEVALVDDNIRQLIKNGLIYNDNVNYEKHIQPASLDLPITTIGYCIKDRVIPKQDFIDDFLFKPNQILHDLFLTEENEAILLKNQTYLIYCCTINLPKDVRAQCSPKSSIGRVDLMVRTLVDGCKFYDIIPTGRFCAIWLQLSPQSFNVKIKNGMCFTQMMLFQTINTKLEKTNDIVLSKQPELFLDGSIILHLNLNLSKYVGFEAKETNQLLDLTLQEHTIDANDFFIPITCDNEALTLEKNKFYILTTNEFISIPPDISAEMIPFLSHIGEVRVHYAGFFDPGFGWKQNDENEKDKNNENNENNENKEHKEHQKGTMAVLEIRPYETITVYHNQPIALMKSYQNKQKPSIVYGSSSLKSHYQYQTGPTLAKWFF